MCQGYTLIRSGKGVSEVFARAGRLQFKIVRIGVAHQEIDTWNISVLLDMINFR